MISFHPGSGGEGDGRPLLLYEAEDGTRSPCNGGTVDCSVRLWLTNSESNEQRCEAALHFGGFYLFGVPRCATGTKSARAGSPYGGIGAVPPDAPVSQRRRPSITNE